MCDDGRRLANELCASVFELIFEAVNDADNGVNALKIKPLDVSVAIHE